MVFQFEFNQYLFSKLSPLFVFSISVVKLINQSFDLYDRPAFKMNIYHKLKVSYIIILVIIKHLPYWMSLAESNQQLINIS
jgi:hypothetical protein